MPTSVAVVCGGVGAARFLRGLIRAVDPTLVTAIVNTADDMVLHGLAISPDLDTCTYTLAEVINPETGWGLVGETWQARDVLERYGGQTWFGLGDRDLGTHLFRTQRLVEGATLSTVTAEITAAWNLPLRVLPMTDDQVRTKVTLTDGETIDFQRYFVERQHAVPVTAVHFAGADDAAPAPGVLEAIADADVVVIAPSNPFVSIDPVLSVPGIRESISSDRGRVVAVSPIVGGAAVKGPAADLMRGFGYEVSAAGIAEVYRDLAQHLIVDMVDGHLSDAITAAGMTPHVTDTMMVSPEVAADLARFTVGAVTNETDTDPA